MLILICIITKVFTTKTLSKCVFQWTRNLYKPVCACWRRFLLQAAERNAAPLTSGMCYTEFPQSVNAVMLVLPLWGRLSVQSPGGSGKAAVAVQTVVVLRSVQVCEYELWINKGWTIVPLSLILCSKTNTWVDILK